MKSIKLILLSVIAAAILSSCGMNNSTSATQAPQATSSSDNGNVSDTDNGSISEDTDNAADDAGDAVRDAGDAAGDVVEGAGDAAGDVAEDVGDAVNMNDDDI